MSVAIKSNPALWHRIVSKVKAENTGGTAPGQWSARKAQIAVQRYKSAGGRYKGPKSSKNHLSQWGRQKWTTKSGRPSHITGERYLPKKAIKALSSKEYSLVSREKRSAMRQGRQFSRMPRYISKKIKKYRS